MNMNTNELTTKCHELWSDVLKTDDIGRQEDFFDQGGTSLSLLELLAETRKQFSVVLKVTDFEQGLTLELFENLVQNSINKELVSA